MNYMMKYRKEIITSLALIIVAFVTRLMPHVWNVTAAGAVAIASGMYLRGKLAIIVPLIAMLLSDIFIGFYNPFIMTSVYVGMVLAVYISSHIANRVSGQPADALSNEPVSKRNISGKNTKNTLMAFFAKTTIASTLSTISFFVLTNWAVWFFGTLYPKNINGLGASYIAGLPFLRNSFFGDLFFTYVVCGAIAISYATIANLAVSKHVSEAGEIAPAFVKAQK